GQCVVGTAGLVVDRRVARHRLIEETAIKYQVALNALNAAAAQGLEHVAQLILDEEGIATASEQQVAVQHAVFYWTQCVEPGLPDVGRAETVQCGEGGQQFDGRGRI